MKDYVFFFNNKNFKLIELNKLEKSQAEDLENQGFSRTDFQAKSREDAISKINESNELNINSLKDFSGDTGFSAVIESLLR
ncbi:hypothetical protein ED28_03850 [[Pantoea] beijingensis]|uniref:Uncharacterized protein n=1 Tax=[Pantoea] beijingensis TaxID=1324864 RepID=A0A443IGK5_9GAMM|nr:hypothetical protein [[Pantoea] beijingensis]RWR03172.1 hypothetical protein ED28_03850 [[Pantoea] beijingensis]